MKKTSRTQEYSERIARLSKEELKTKILCIDEIREKIISLGYLSKSEKNMLVVLASRKLVLMFELNTRKDG